MKKYLIISLLILSLLITSVGMAAEKKVTLKFANWGSTEKATSENFKKMIADFEAENRNIKIESIGFPYGDIKQQVLVMSAGGDVLDVVQAERAMVNTYIGSGYVSDLDRYFSKAYLADFYPNVLKDLRSGGKLYGIPWITSPWLLVYNKELFVKAGLNPNAPPKTFDEALKYAEKLSKLKDKDGNSVYGMGETTGLVPISGSSVYRIMVSFGGGIWNKGKVQVNNKGNIAAFKYLKQLCENNYTPNNAKLKDLRNLMAIGRLGMYFDQAWGVGGVFGINPAIKPQIAVAALPATDVTKGVSNLNAHVLCIMKASKHKKEASQFIGYITSKPVMKTLVNTTPFFAPRQSIDNDPDFHDAFLNSAKDGMNQIAPLPKQDPNYENAYLELVKAAQMVTIGGQSPELALKNLQSKLQTILK